MLRPMREKEDQTGFLKKTALGLDKHEMGGQRNQKGEDWM